MSETKEVVEVMPQYEVLLSKELQEYTYNQCKYMNVPYSLEIALLHTESGFNGDAISYNGRCKGIGQLCGSTGTYLAKILQIQNYNPFNEKHNIACNVYHLWELTKYYTDKGYSENEVTYCVLGAYNRGVAGFNRYVWNNGTIVTSYANKVIGYKENLESYNKLYI